jgi:putative colanic acid biosynthesis UDP-glucose lipid carrier transferase
MNERNGEIRIRRVSQMTVGWDNLLQLVEATLDPLVLVMSLWAVAFNSAGELTPPYMILSLIVFALTFPGTSRLQIGGTQLLISIFGGWIAIAGLLLFFGYASRYIHQFDREALITWLWLAPVAQLTTHGGFRLAAPVLRRLQKGQKRSVIAGINEQGIALALHIRESPYTSSQLIGFFDDRDANRVSRPAEIPFLGTFTNLPLYVKANNIQLIYLSLPMATQPRILALLDALRDTTASIYFVPDIFVTDLIQGRMDAVGDIPVVAVCETPFTRSQRFVQAPQRYSPVVNHPGIDVTAAGGDRHRRQTDFARAGDFPAAPLWPRWRGDRCLQISLDDSLRRRRQHRSGAQERLPHHGAGRHPAQVVAGRTAAIR